MPVYKIDANRGNDANDGITAPWQNLSRLGSFTPVSGDVIALASDSWFRPTNRVSMAYNTAGTRAAPVLITSYDPAGASLYKPRISLRRTLVAGDFASDADGWYFDAVGMSAAALNWHCFVRLGGMDGLRMEAALSTMKDLKIDRTWLESGTRLYIYSPPGINPVHYYGSVEFGHSSKTFACNGYARFLIVEKLHICDGAGLANYYTSDLPRTLIFRDIEADDATVALSFYPDTGSNCTIEVYDSKFNESQSSHIATYNASNVLLGSLTIRNNDFSGGNRGYPQGQVYLQTRQAWTLVTGNRHRGARYGTIHHQQDGCAIYTEIGSDRAVIAGNLVTDSHCAFEDNSGRRSTWMGNVVLNCFAAMKLDDWSGAGATNHRAYNNTIINAGAPVPPSGPVQMGGIGWWTYRDFAVDLRNNLFTKHPSAPANAAIELGSAATGTIANNAEYGFRALAETYQAAASPITPTGTVSGAPLIDASGRLLPGSPLIGAGQFIPGVRHMNGQPQRVPADIGAYAYEPPRPVALIRA